MKNQSIVESEMSKLLIVMGYIAVKELNNIPEKVTVLHNLGYNNRQMALICNTTEGTVAVQKTANKKQKKKKSK